MAGKITFDPEQMTIGDGRELKKLAKEQGYTWKETMEGLEFGDPDILALAIYVSEHRRDPSITLADVYTMTLDEAKGPDKASGDEAPEQEQDPTDAAGSSS